MGGSDIGEWYPFHGPELADDDEILPDRHAVGFQMGCVTRDEVTGNVSRATDVSPSKRYVFVVGYVFASFKVSTYSASKGELSPFVIVGLFHKRGSRFLGQ